MNGHWPSCLRVLKPGKQDIHQLAITAKWLNKFIYDVWKVVVFIFKPQQVLFKQD